jgi:hypothetical protein
MSVEIRLLGQNNEMGQHTQLGQHMQLVLRGRLRQLVHVHNRCIRTEKIQSNRLPGLRRRILVQLQLGLLLLARHQHQLLEKWLVQHM